MFSNQIDCCGNSQGIRAEVLTPVIALFYVLATRFCGRVAPQLDAESRSDSATLRLSAWQPLLLPALLLLGVSGCLSPPSLGRRDFYRTSPELAAITVPVMERGEPRPIIDGIGWIFGIPAKIILWDRRVDNHHISPITEQAVAQYLELNELDSVKVRLNQYAPLDEWHRLRTNSSVGWGWRYTAGTLAWLYDTVLPGRIFGGDHYNPFTNTIYIYSDLPAVGLHEAGHAKDFAQRNYKGTYAVLYALPLVPLWHEAIASRDALAYLRDFGTVEEEQEACRILYPAYGTYVGSAAADLLPWNGGLVFAAAVIPGHVVGRVRAAQVPAERATQPTATIDSDGEFTPPDAIGYQDD
jgi:hypothetical protein